MLMSFARHTHTHVQHVMLQLYETKTRFCFEHGACEEFPSKDTSASQMRITAGLQLSGCLVPIFYSYLTSYLILACSFVAMKVVTS